MRRSPWEPRRRAWRGRQLGFGWHGAGSGARVCKAARVIDPAVLGDRDWGLGNRQPGGIEAEGSEEEEEAKKRWLLCWEGHWMDAAAGLI
uniref:Uncharacterized protein n=1 Tax=Arundo donax TaxID=35708 RepID=A0A0A9EBC4_ARUDO